MMLSKAIRSRGLCWGTWMGRPCPISMSRHRRGVIDGMGVIHFADRRLTRRAARNLLLLIARREREANPAFLNDPMYDWLYVYLDSVRAYQLGMEAGIRLPARLFDAERRRCLALMARRNAPMTRRRGLRSWLQRSA